MKKVGIIGAGACGLFLANLLANEYEVTLFEKNNKLGKKILASGNGRCNFTNVGDYKNKYNNNFANEIISNFDNVKTREFFSSLNLAYKIDEEGRAYPLSDSSNSVLDVLKKGLKNVKILLDTRVENIDYERMRIITKKEEYKFDYIVCSSGSIASNLGSEHAYDYLKNINFITPRASLTQVNVKQDLTLMEGLRFQCRVNLYKNDQLIYSENGEVLFKKDCLSGIAIFNISSIINRDLKAKYKISLDLFSCMHNKVNLDDLIGVLHPKMVEYINKNNLKDLNNLIFNVDSLNDDYKNCQVISGGVSLDEVNKDLSLKKYKNVYVGGELLDIDGMCGGYNLQFAFSSAYTIYQSIKASE